MHILKCKQEENRNKILRNRLFIRKQSQSNPHLEDIVNRYDDYYEEFKNKIVMQIGALERLLKYLKDLETSKHKTHHHQHHHYHHYDKRRDEYEERHEQIENDQEYQGENVKASGKKKVPRAVVAGIKRDQQMIFKEIRKLKNALLMKGSNREAKYKELSKYIDGIDDDANKTDNNLFKIKRDQEQILQTLGKITRDVEKFD
jgi:chromosome segregation ATPase